MDLSIIIVNWKSVDYLVKCIDSICANVAKLSVEIIVVDNDSRDECATLLLEKYPSVRVLEMTTNIGFSRANNAGARCASGRNLLFLNPDTVVVGDAIGALIRVLDKTPLAGVAGARLLNADSSIQQNCVRSFPTLTNQLLAFDIIIKTWPGLNLFGRSALLVGHDSDPLEVDVVCGAALAVRRNLFDAVGGFSTEYFMYAEESDFCQKIRSSGHTVLHVPSALVVHYGGQSSKKRGNYFAEVLMRESNYRLLRKFKGSAYALAYRLTTLMGAVSRLTAAAPAAMIPFSCRVRSSGRSLCGKWWRIAKWGIFLERWVCDAGGLQSQRSD